MKIYNKTTGKTVELSIYDRSTGIEWTSDLIGNHGDLHYNDDLEMNEFDQDAIDWWRKTIAGLNEIEDLKEQAEELSEDDDFETLLRKLEDEGNGDDLEQHIATLIPILKEYVAERV